MSSTQILLEDQNNRLEFLNSKPQEPRHRALLAKTLDATILGPNVTTSLVETLCKSALNAQVRSVCIPSAFLPVAKKLLENSSIYLCTVIDFPWGQSTLESKLDQASRAVEAGAHEIDFVHNTHWVMENRWDEVQMEYRTLAKIAKDSITKVILETSQLTLSQIEKCTQLAQNSGICIIKTSTGFSSRGASLEDITTIKSALVQNPNRPIGIKASGGIRSYTQAIAFIEAGATRIGTSQPLSLLEVP